MQVSVQTLSGLQRKITVKVPAAEFRSEVDKRINSLIPKVKIPGFRPGKVPPQVIRQRYGDSVRAEVMSETIQNTYFKALEQENLRPVGNPTIEVTSPEGEEIEYQATVEVYPEIKVTTLENVELEKYKVAITPEMVEEVIEKVRRQHANWAEVERDTQKGDRILLDFESRIQGQTFEGGTGKDVTMELGIGSAIPDFERQLIGVKPHQSFDFSIRFPEDYHRAELSGKAAMVNAIIKRVEEANLPEVDEEFIKKLGVTDGDMETLRADVRKNIDRDLEAASRNHLKNQVIKKVLELNSFEIPEMLITMEIDNLKKQAEQAPKHEKAQLPSDEKLRETAERRVKLGIIFGELIRTRNLKADENKVNETVQNFAMQFNDPRILEWFKKDKNRMDQIQSMVLEEQVVDELAKEATIIEKDMQYGEMEKLKQEEEI